MHKGNGYPKGDDTPAPSYIMLIEIVDVVEQRQALAVRPLDGIKIRQPRIGIVIMIIPQESMGGVQNGPYEYGKRKASGWDTHRIFHEKTVREEGILASCNLFRLS